MASFTYGVRVDQDGCCCFEMTFRSEIIFQIPSPINNNPSNTVKPIVRPMPPISSDERLAWKMVTIMPTIISPPLVKSNIGIGFADTFLPTIKAIIDIITAPPPKNIPRTCSSNGKKPFPLTPSGEAIEADRTSAP